RGRALRDHERRDARCRARLRPLGGQARDPHARQSGLHRQPPARPLHARLDLRRAVRRVPRAALRAAADSAQDARRGLVRAQVGDGLLRLLRRGTAAEPRDLRATLLTMSDASQLRASDEDRERYAQSLREHFAAGRIADDELAERLDEVYAARTVAELEAVVHDLPALPATAAASRAELASRRAELRRHLLQQAGG